MDGGWKEYFVFSRKERFAIYLLVIIIAILIFIPSIISRTAKPEENIVWLPVDSILNDQLGEFNNPGSVSQVSDKKLLKEIEDYVSKPIAGPVEHPHELFYFDPNNASPETLRKLGIKERQVITIQRYVSKGGRFRKAEDLGRVYGMSEAEVKRLLPFVRIKPGNRPSLKFNESNMQNPKLIAKTANSFRPVNHPVDNQGKRAPEFSINVLAPIEINSASKQDWERLPGIGATLATRIVTFREKLGGFYSVLQVAETYGLPDSTYRKIMTMLTCDSSSCKKLPINKVTEEQLNYHPYFRGATATALVKYRNEHGEFKDISDLKKIKSINQQVFNRISPYTSINTSQ